jgi:hypothetical protein
MKADYFFHICVTSWNRVHCVSFWRPALPLRATFGQEQQLRNEVRLEEAAELGLIRVSLLEL